MAPTAAERKVLTMAECINREAAIRALLNDAPEQVSYSREDAADCIRYMDAADVAPVVHGRWLYGDYYDIGDVCSECDWDSKMIHPSYRYCPNCGAKMDEEVSE